LRGFVGHGGVVGARRLIVPSLVHPKAGTHRVLRELAAMGDLAQERAKWMRVRCV